MKVARTYTLDQEIVERLANLNASDLINRLLKDHFVSYNPKNTLLDEKKAIIKQLLKKKDRFLPKLRSLKNGMSSAWITLLRTGSKPGKAIQRFLKFLSTLRIEISRSPQQNLKEPVISQINTETC